MSAALATLLASLVSVAGIVLLAAFNPKRRRSFGLAQRNSRAATALGWALILAPLIWLLARGETAPVMLWFGAVSVAGWAVAMRRPA
jgi:hypothetical protein